MVLTRFLPRDERFFDYFREAARNAAEAAAALVDLFEHFEDVEQKVRHLRQIERQGDEITHQIFNALNRTFVTPIDREDIRALASAIDDFVDAIEDVAKRIWIYRVQAPTPIAISMAHIVDEQARLLVETVPLVERTKDSASLKRQIVIINRLENEADDLLDGALADVFDGAADIPALIRALRWSELYQELEEATDQAEDVANTLEGIMLKNA
jgi:predicted phosphate transport protein (TIGR00153 family)